MQNGNKKKKRLLFLIHALNPAGAQRVLVDLVNNLDQERYDITVQTIHNKGELRNELRAHIRQKAIIRSNNRTLAYLHGLLIRRVLPSACSYNIWIKDDYDVEVAFLEGECTKLISASSNQKALKYAWVHVDFNVLFDAAKCFRTTKQHCRAYSKFDNVVCVSEAVMNGFSKKITTSSNALVRYNVLDEEKVITKANEKMTQSHTVVENQLHFVCVGNMRAEKGYERLLKVCQRLIADGYKFSLNIIGGGALLDSIKGLINELHLQEYVRVLGEQSNPYTYMKQADALICSSYTEGYSTVAVEASLLGVPTLTTECSGMREIFGDSEYGMIVENSEEGLYQGIRSICQNPEQLYAYREKLQERGQVFSKKNRIKAIEELWNK